MLKKEDFIVIKALVQRGVYHKDIAVELGIHPKTVSRALKRGSAPPPRPARRGSKLDPFKPLVDRLLAEGVWNGVVILRELQAAATPASHTILRDYLRPKRALRPSRATVRFETAPGRQLQSDWGELVTDLAGQPTTVNFICNQLGYSRRFHFWCAPSQDAEHTYEGLIRSFEYFAGVPQEVLVDNQKVAVLVHRPIASNSTSAFWIWRRTTASRRAPVGRTARAPKARMSAWSAISSTISSCAIAHFDSWAHLNQLAEQWLREEADLRMHGTVHEVVAERFAREQPTLQPLPSQRYDTAYYEHRKVGWDTYIDVRGNRYSLPDALAGKVVAVRIGLDDTLRVYHDDALIVTYTLQDAAGRLGHHPRASPPRCGKPWRRLSSAPWPCMRRWRHGAKQPAGQTQAGTPGCPARRGVRTGRRPRPGLQKLPGPSAGNRMAGTLPARH